jgi:hypothetical protein
MHGSTQLILRLQRLLRVRTQSAAASHQQRQQSKDARGGGGRSNHGGGERNKGSRPAVHTENTKNHINE